MAKVRGPWRVHRASTFEFLKSCRFFQPDLSCGGERFTLRL